VFDDKENIIGVLLLSLCAVVAGVFIWSMVTGRELSYNGPQWLTWVLGIIFFAGIGYGMWQSLSGRFRSGGSPQWPDVGSGRRPWWKFWGK